ncbi:MAG: histidinol dehydrogenase [Pseudomonadota bacterium]
MIQLINRLATHETNFSSRLTRLVSWSADSDDSVQQTVKNILNDVRLNGDHALLTYTQQFDRFETASSETIHVSPERIDTALNAISPEQRHSLEAAAERIRLFHQKQVQKSWHYEELNGTRLGQQVRPLDSVGVYVPGGKAAYPSSVLMNVIPAKVAGVQQVTMVSPAMNGEVNDMVLAAAAISGVDDVCLVGGAQAVAALAYGTQSIAKVDKIVGPGNVYVAAAKREVFGVVGIDMIAGPSEILIICDGKTPADWIAMDLFSQAEHDEQAQAILISDDEAFLAQVEASIERLLPTMEREEIIRKSLADRGALILVNDLDEAIALSNQIAPEHLELSIDDPNAVLPKIKHAGAIFSGRYTPEAFGDYCAGPNHVLPTSGTARFSSPLGVYDFQKRSSVIHCSEQGADELARVASVLARGESLTAHARSAEYRLNDSKSSQ